MRSAALLFCCQPQGLIPFLTYELFHWGEPPSEALFGRVQATSAVGQAAVKFGRRDDAVVVVLLGNDHEGVEQFLQEGALPLGVAGIHQGQRFHDLAAQLDLPLFLGPGQGLFGCVQVDEVVHDVGEDVVVGMEDFGVVEEHLLHGKDVAHAQLRNLL